MASYILSAVSLIALLVFSSFKSGEVFSKSGDKILVVFAWILFFIRSNNRFALCLFCGAGWGEGSDQRHNKNTVTPTSNEVTWHLSHNTPFLIPSNNRLCHDHRDHDHFHKLSPALTHYQYIRSSGFTIVFTLKLVRKFTHYSVSFMKEQVQGVRECVNVGVQGVREWVID